MAVSPTQVGAEKIPELLEILRKEGDAIALSRRELFASKWLAILGLKVMPLLLLSFPVIMVFGGGGLLVFGRDAAWLAFLAVAVLVLGFMALGAAAVILAPFTMSILVKGVRQWLAVRRMSLTVQFHEVWVEKRRDRRLGWPAILALVICFGTAAFLLAVWIIHKNPTGPQHAAYGFFFVIFLVPGFAWVAYRSRQRVEALADLERLTALVSKSAATSQAAGPGEGVALPPEALKQIARIEKAQITRDRVETLQDVRGSVTSAYAVLKTPTVRGVLRSLDVGTRLRLEERIQDLCNDPGVVTAPAGDSSTVRQELVADTSLRLLYQVDGSLKRITVVGIDDTHSGRPDANPRSSNA